MTVGVLLGAGASVPAGVPTAQQMASKILVDEFVLVDDASQPAMERQAFELERFRRVLRFAKYGLGFAMAAENRNPDAEIEIESLVNAVTALRDRTRTEMSAFAAWTPHIDRFLAGQTDWDERRLLLQRLLGELASGEPTARIAPMTLAHNLTQWLRELSEPGEIFSTVRKQVIEAVRLMSMLPAEANLSYLDPLFELFEQQGHLAIGSLNYDRSIEQAGQARGTAVDTAFSQWNTIRRLQFDDSAIRLFKLHGSVDWVRKQLGGAALGGTTIDWTDYESVSEQEMGMFGESLEPGLVFGGENKLRADGPFLDLFRGFADALRRCDRLVVVGYSFRDAHVNQLIQDWGSRDRDLVVVDPNAEELRAKAEQIVLPYSLHIHALPIHLAEATSERLRQALFEDLSRDG